MTPDFDTRLKSISSAMENIIIPAIAADDNMALQQAGLIIKHIAIMRDQLPYLQAFESLCLQDMEILAQQILAAPSIGYVRHQSDALDVALRSSQPTTQDRYISIGRAIEDIVAAAATGQLFDEIAEPVLGFGERQTMRERIWFAGTGFDPDTKSLPSIGAAISTQFAGNGA
ncbi:MAG: hypothetical protein AB7U34_06040 [Novosphingobium sp.]